MATEKQIRDAWAWEKKQGGFLSPDAVSLFVPVDGEVLEFRRQKVTREPIVDSRGLANLGRLPKVPYERIICQGIVLEVKECCPK